MDPHGKLFIRQKKELAAQELQEAQVEYVNLSVTELEELIKLKQSSLTTEELVKEVETRLTRCRPL